MPTQSSFEFQEGQRYLTQSFSELLIGNTGIRSDEALLVIEETDFAVTVPNLREAIFRPFGLTIDGVEIHGFEGDKNQFTAKRTDVLLPKEAVNRLDRIARYIKQSKDDTKVTVGVACLSKRRQVRRKSPGQLLATALSTIPAGISPLVWAWKEYIRDPVIPYDLDLRKRVLADAYAQLSPYINAWEALLASKGGKDEN